MRVNSRVFQERTDMMGNIQIPSCPAEFREYAEKLVMMCCKLDYSVTDYHTMTDLQKHLIVDYWEEYDALPAALSNDIKAFKAWFRSQASAPELLRRAIQWLIAGNYLIVKEDVRQHAQEAGRKFSQSVKGK